MTIHAVQLSELRDASQKLLEASWIQTKYKIPVPREVMANYLAAVNPITIIALCELIESAAKNGNGITVMPMPSGPPN